MFIKTFSWYQLAMKFSDGVDMLACPLAMTRLDFRFEGVNLKQIVALITNLKTRKAIVLYLHVLFDIWVVTIGNITGNAAPHIFDHS